MRDRSHKIIALCALSGALLLGIGIGVAEAHVSQLEREALAAFEAEQIPVLVGTEARAVADEAIVAAPHVVEFSVTREEFAASRAAFLESRKPATL